MHKMDSSNTLTCGVCNSPDKVTVTLTIACCAKCRQFFIINMKKRFKWKPCISKCDACRFCRLEKCLKIGLKFSEGYRKNYKPQKYTADEVKDILINGNVEIAKVTENEDRGQPCTVCQKPRSADVKYQSGGSCSSCYGFFQRYKSQQLQACDNKCTLSYECSTMCFSCRYQQCLAVGLKPKVGKRRRRQKLEEEIPAKKPRLTSLTDSQTDSSSGEESDQKFDNESEFKRKRLSIAAVIAEKEHKFMVSYFH